MSKRSRRNGLDPIESIPKIELLVTRHNGVLNLFRESGMIKKDCRIIRHAHVHDVMGKHVAGIIPVPLASYCASYTAIEIQYPPELRGMELTEEEVRRYFRGFTRFKVEVLRYGSSDLENFMRNSEPYVSQQAYRS